MFLGWNRSFLPAVLEYLRSSDLDADAGDMSSVILVTPGREAGRRLQDLFAEPENVDSTPTPDSLPRFITQGELGTELYEPTLVQANSIQETVARVASMAEHEDLVRTVIPPYNANSDVASRVRLAGDLNQLESDLAGADITCEAASKISADKFDVEDERRWHALADLNRAQGATLARAGLCAKHTSGCEGWSPADIRKKVFVLVACVDLNKATQRKLRETDAQIVVLIWAPEGCASDFNDVGCLVPELWHDRTVPLGTSVAFADTPNDQAARIAQQIKKLPIEHRHQVTVSLPDESIGATIARVLEADGIPVRRTSGRDIRTTAPVLMLRAVADVLDAPTPQSMGVLLRQPDVLNLISGDLLDAPHTSISHLDSFTEHHLPTTLDLSWDVLQCSAEDRLSDPTLTGSEQGAAREDLRDVKQLASVIPEINELVRLFQGEGSVNRVCPLYDWAESIAQLLTDVYGGRTFATTDPGDVYLARTIKTIGTHLQHIDELRSFDFVKINVTGSEAIRFLLAVLVDSAVAEEFTGNEVDVTGWLDAPLNDAPFMIVAGVNEGYLPESYAGDALLPNRMRTALGLPDSASRYARDAYYLTAMHHARQGRLSVISGRFTDEGDPLRPSRLLFACDDEILLERALSFYSASQPDSSQASLPHGSDYPIARIPLPEATKVDVVSVSNFKDYIACPYRFYLKNILRLEHTEEPGNEISARLFGTMAHLLMSRFAVSDVRETTDHAAINDFLTNGLRTIFRDQLGASLTSTLQYQRQQLERRLEKFSIAQAEWVAAGWRIKHVEQEFEMMSKQGIKIEGRIDRVDENIETGRYCVQDYKFGDTFKDPVAAHWDKKTGTWIDLQLPLYRELVVQSGIDASKIDVGYISIPADLSKIKFQTAPWTAVDYDDANATMDSILTSITMGVFWPPKSRSGVRYTDGFEIICMDDVQNRQEIIRKSTELAGTGGVS